MIFLGRIQTRTNTSWIQKCHAVVLYNFCIPTKIKIKVGFMYAMMLIPNKLNNIYWRKVNEMLQKNVIIHDASGNSCDPQFHSFEGAENAADQMKPRVFGPRRWLSMNSPRQVVCQFSALPIVLLLVVSGQSIKPLHGIGSNNRTVWTVVASLFAEIEDYPSVLAYSMPPIGRRINEYEYEIFQ